MKHLYTLVLLFIISGTAVKGQQPLTDKILIEFMKPGDKDAEAKGYNILPWPEEAKAAAYKAADIWASYLEITVPIRIKFGWCDNIESYALGGAKYNYQYTNGYYYPLALINQLLGYDKNKDVVDITCVFNSTIKIGWYFSLDGGPGLTPDPNDPGIQYFQQDFLTTALHEICHGLGITSSMTIEGGKGKYGSSIGDIPSIYDTFLCDKNGNSLINKQIYQNNSVDLANALTSADIYWSSIHGKENNNDTDIKINAPKEWSTSSICHIAEDYAKTNNKLMAFQGTTPGKHQHTPGAFILRMLQDIGWTIKDTPTTNEFIEQKISDIRVYTIGDWIKIEGADQFSMVSVIDMSGRVRYLGSETNEIHLSSGIYIVKIGDQSFKVKI